MISKILTTAAAIAAHIKGKPLTPLGQEVPDPTPIAPPIGYQRSKPLAEQIREMVRSEQLRRELEGTGAETFEEADDFDVGDDFEDNTPETPYEAVFEPPVSPDPPQAPTPAPPPVASPATAPAAPTAPPVAADPKISA